MTRCYGPYISIKPWIENFKIQISDKINKWIPIVPGTKLYSNISTSTVDLGNHVNLSITNNVINAKHKVEKNNISYNESMSVTDKFDKVKSE